MLPRDTEKAATWISPSTSRRRVVSSFATLGSTAWDRGKEQFHFSAVKALTRTRFRIKMTVSLEIFSGQKQAREAGALQERKVNKPSNYRWLNEIDYSFRDREPAPC